MWRRRYLVLFVLMLTIAAGSVAAPSVAAGAADAAETTAGTETPDDSETANPTHTSTTPADGPDSHADDPFPSWLPLLSAGGLLVGIVAVGGGLRFAFSRVRRFLRR
ncbi:hypothetical protein BRD15_06780 [Halobacteriales archaeon SW_6_65_15]|jgi:hypothetical protein|nr:MAG: hypothetical protein BRD15_06780 [Halobacteriales archaeon SW_6_65_15]